MLSLLLTERSKGLHYFLGPAPSLPGTDWLQNVETLKESLRLAGSGSIDLNSVDMAQFQGTIFSVYITRHIPGNWLTCYFFQLALTLIFREYRDSCYLVLHFLHVSY